MSLQDTHQATVCLLPLVHEQPTPCPACSQPFKPIPGPWPVSGDGMAICDDCALDDPALANAWEAAIDDYIAWKARL